MDFQRALHFHHAKLQRGFRGGVSITFNSGAVFTLPQTNCTPWASTSPQVSASFTTCADGSTPGTYLTVTTQYPFLALFPGDTYLVGKTLNERMVSILQ